MLTETRRRREFVSSTSLYSPPFDEGTDGGFVVTLDEMPQLFSTMQDQVSDSDMLELQAARPFQLRTTTPSVRMTANLRAVALAGIRISRHNLDNRWAIRALWTSDTLPKTV